MAKIKVANPVVELDGDEMTRVIWDLIKKKLILPYLDVTLEYYDLGVEKRDQTDDQITIDAAEAIKRHGVGVKCATITPDEARVKEFNLKQMWKSPNGTIRNILGGTIFREPIICRQCAAPRAGLDPAHRHRPPCLWRSVPRDRFRRAGPGQADRRLDGKRRQEDRARSVRFPRRRRRMTMYNLDQSIIDFARASMNYALARKYPLYLSTKNTIVKAYDGRFKDLFEKVFREEFADAVQIGGTYLRAPADRRHGGGGAEMVRRLCLGVQELRRRCAVRHGRAGVWFARADDQRPDVAGWQDRGIRSGTWHGHAPLPAVSEGPADLDQLHRVDLCLDARAVRIAPSSTTIPIWRVLRQAWKRSASIRWNPVT